MFPGGSTSGGILDHDPHVSLVEKVDVISLFDSSFGEMMDPNFLTTFSVRMTASLLACVGCGWSIEVVGVDSILNVGCSMLSPSIESLLVDLNLGDRGT